VAFGNRAINPAGEPAEFLAEERFRGRYPNGTYLSPMPHFSQPDTGAHHVVGGSLDLSYDIASRPMHVGNQTTDLHGGYY